MNKWTKRLVLLAWLVLAGVTGWVSYWTQVDLFTRVCHESTISAHLMPAASDCLMVLAAVKILERKGMHWRKRVFPTLVMYAALGVSVWANLATAEPGNYASMFSRGWVAVALWCAVEMLVRPTVKPVKAKVFDAARVTRAVVGSDVTEVVARQAEKSPSKAELLRRAAEMGVKGRTRMSWGQLAEVTGVQV